MIFNADILSHYYLIVSRTLVVVGSIPTMYLFFFPFLFLIHGDMVATKTTLRDTTNIHMTPCWHFLLAGVGAVLFSLVCLFLLICFPPLALS